MVIVDDVMTTGATLVEAARVRECGAHLVRRCSPRPSDNRLSATANPISARDTDIPLGRWCGPNHRVRCARADHQSKPQGGLVDIVVTGRHVNVSDRFRQHITEKLAKVTQSRPGPAGSRSWSAMNPTAGRPRRANASRSRATTRGRWCAEAR